MSRTREEIIEKVRKMLDHTFERGCNPAEAAGFAAKAAEWIEKYNIGEAELRQRSGGDPLADEAEVCENVLRTGKRAHNPGVTALVTGLAHGMCCEVVMSSRGRGDEREAVYGIIGDPLDADYVCQMATTVLPALQIMADLEGREHGHEKAGLVRWCNQYLIGAGAEVRRRLERDRKDRSDAKEAERKLLVGDTGRALMCVTGETIAASKRESSAEALKRLYPKVRTVISRSGYDSDARERGREAGRTVGLNLAVEDRR